MDLRGYTTVDEVGGDTQVRNVENFKPATAAEEIEYLNKILEKMEKCDMKENSEGVDDDEPHKNHSCNNNAVNPVTDDCSEKTNAGHGVCEQNCLRNKSSDKLEQHMEKFSVNEILDQRKSGFNEYDDEGHGLPCADDILTQAESQHSVIQENKGGHVQNELSTEPNLMMADPSVPDLESNSRQSSGCAQINISPDAEPEEKLEAYSIEPCIFYAPNETGSSELSSGTMEATIMPVNCSVGSSTVLESRHYSAKDTLNFVSGEVSESLNLESVELEEVAASSNVVLGDIGSLLKSSGDQSDDVENTTSEYETQVDLSIVKSEPICTDPGEEFDLGDFCSDPGESFVLKDHSIKEEPLDYSPPGTTMSQEEVLLPVKIFKSEGGSSEEHIVIPNIRYLVEEHKQYSREEVAAALIISQSSLSPTIDMEMFQNLGRTKLAVSLDRLEDMIKCPKQLALEDFDVVLLFRNNYGISVHEWKNFFNFRTNYSVKHTGRGNTGKQDKRKGKRGRKRKVETEQSSSSVIKTDEAKNENSEERETGDHGIGQMCDDSIHVVRSKVEAAWLEKGMVEDGSWEYADSLELEESKASNGNKGKRGKKKCMTENSHSDGECSKSAVIVEREGSEEKEHKNYESSQMSDETMKADLEEAGQLNHGADDESSHEYKGCSDFETESQISEASSVSHGKKRKKTAGQVDDVEVKSNSLTLENMENMKLQLTELISLDAENKVKNTEPCQQQNIACKACSVNLYDIAKDAVYGKVVREFMKHISHSRVLDSNIDKTLQENSAENEVSQRSVKEEDDISKLGYSVTGFSAVKVKETPTEVVTDREMYVKCESLPSDEDRVDCAQVLGKEDYASEKSDAGVSQGDKSEKSSSEENKDAGMKLGKEDKAEIKMEKENKTGIKQDKEEFQKEKDDRRARKRVKLEDEFEPDAGRRNSSRDKKKSLLESDNNTSNLEISEGKEESVLKPNDTKKDGALDLVDFKKSKEDFPINKDRSPVASSLPSLSTFKIPKKKVINVEEYRAREQNSILLRRGENPALQKSVGYFSAKELSAQGRKRACRERESYTSSNIKKDNKSTLPVQPHVVEGWAKRGPLSAQRSSYRPQAGFPNIPIVNKSPVPGTLLGPASTKAHMETAPGTLLGPASTKAHMETANQLRMRFDSQMGGERPHVVPRNEYRSLPSSEYGVTCIDKPAKPVNIPLSVPPPPPLEKLDLDSLMLDGESGNVQPYEPSPGMSHGNSSDGESDVGEICKGNIGSAQLPSSNVFCAPNQNEDPSKNKVEATEKAFKDHYHHLDKRQKMKLYEKRKWYYYESKRRFHAEKEEKKKFWFKEYEKRKKEYYHLKYYLYKEKKREHMESRLQRERQDARTNCEDKISEVIQGNSELCAEVESAEQEASSNAAGEAEEIPYSPTGSPVDFEDADFQASLLDRVPAKRPCNEKDQGGNIPVTYPTEKLKEMIRHVTHALNQHSSQHQCSTESQSEVTEAKFKDDEAAAAADIEPLESASLAAILRTSESFLSSSLPLPLPLQEILMPTLATSPSGDNVPLPVPPPSLTSLQFASSSTLLKDSASKSSVGSISCGSAVSVLPPQPVPAPTLVSSSTFSFASAKKLDREQSTLHVRLPVSAPAAKPSLAEKSPPEVQTEFSVPTSLTQENDVLPPLPQSPASPLPGQKLTKKASASAHSVPSFSSIPYGSNVLPPLPAAPLPVQKSTKESRSVQEYSSRLSVPLGKDTLPPVPAPPLPPPVGEIPEKISRFVNADKGRLQEVNASDDMTQVPMDIDSDNESDDETSNRFDNGNREATKHYESDKEFLALFGIRKDDSVTAEKDADENSIEGVHMARLLRKLMNATKTEPVAKLEIGGRGPNTGMKDDAPKSCLKSIPPNSQEMVVCHSLRGQNTPPVTDVNISTAVSPIHNNKDVAKVSKTTAKDRKGMSLDQTPGASLKCEIEIVGTKEPPKNLFCVDEILMSVKAADRPADLEIIYADLKGKGTKKINTIRDEVPKYYQKTALAQTLVDKCKDIPLVGLQYVLEVRKDVEMTLDSCYYICAVCSKKMTAHTLVAHIKSVPHRLKFSETHCKSIYDKYGSYALKEWTTGLVKEFTKDLSGIEEKMGRHKLAVAFEREISSVLKCLKEKICKISSLSQLQEEKTKVSVSSSASNVSEPAETTGTSVKDTPLPTNNEASVPAKSNSIIPLPPKPESPGSKGGSTENKKNYAYDGEEDEVTVLTDAKKAAKKFSSNGQGFTKRNYRPGPNVRGRSSSRSTTPTLSPRKTLSRSKSLSPRRNIVHSPPNKQKKHSRSPPRRKADRRSPDRRSPDRRSTDRHSHLPGRKRRHSRSPFSPHHHSRSRSRSRETRKRYRTRSRSRSRHRSPYRRKDSWAHRTPPPKRESSEERARRVARRKLEDFREAETRIRARHKNELIVFEKTPESHPLYNREWKIFWERRCRELEREGVDPFLYDFKSEWAKFWHHRMKELMDKNFKAKRDAVLRKLKLEDPDLEENKSCIAKKSQSSTWKPVAGSKEKISRIDRSPSPWEHDDHTSGIARNPSPTPGEINTARGSSKSNEIPSTKFEDDFSVIGTLKLLNELEDQLGSFGPAITTLLGKAVDCSQKGEDTLELFKDPDNLVLVRYAREKLSSQISAGILGVSALVRTQMAVERSMWLQSQAEKLANEGKYLGLDITGIARATLGRDTFQIAQYIAQHLLQVGKSDASEGNLQNILYAVLAAHTKLLVETSKKVQADTPGMESTSPVGVSVISGPSDPPKELPPAAPSETSVDIKQPLFPSTVSADGDRSVDSENDRDSSEKVKGGLGMLQNAYEEENGKEMENLSLDDLRSLLSNFSSLSAEEKQALTTYLKKLEATDSKKVMKLREEIQKSAKNAAKASNVKSASRSVKSSTRSESTQQTVFNNSASLKQPSEALQAAISGKVPPPKTGDDRDTRQHSMENINQPSVASQRHTFIANSLTTGAIHGSKGIVGAPAGLDSPTCSMPPGGTDPPLCNFQQTPRVSEVAPDYGLNTSHKTDSMDQAVFIDGRDHRFPQRAPLPRQETGGGSPGVTKQNVNNQDTNYDCFGYDPLPGHNNPMDPEDLGRFDRLGEPRFDRPEETRFDRPGEPRFDRPGEPSFDRPGDPRFDRLGEPRFDRPGETRFDRPGETRFDKPGEPRFERPGEPRFDRPGELRFDRPGEPRFDRPGEPVFDGSGESRLDRPGEPKFDGSGEPRFDRPGEPRFGRPEPRFDRSQEPRLGEPEPRFDRPGEPYNPHWQAFSRSGQQMDDLAFSQQDRWFDDTHEPREFAPRGRPGHLFRGGPRRGHHMNARQPYRELW